MALIARFTRLFRADVHAVLDKIEEPALLLQQSIREMEEGVADDERQIRQWELEQIQLTQKCAQLKEVSRELKENCALCFKNDKEDLAKPFIRRQLETRQTLDWLAGKQSELAGKSAQLLQQLAERRTRLTAIKQHAELLVQANSAAYSNPLDNPLTTVRDEDVEVAFLQAKQKWSES